MYLASNNPDTQESSIYAVSLKDRTFILSPQAYAIIQHHCEATPDISPDTMLDALILTVDAMLLKAGCNKATAVINGDGTSTYSFSPELAPVKLEHLKVV